MHTFLAVKDYFPEAAIPPLAVIPGRPQAGAGIHIRHRSDHCQRRGYGFRAPAFGAPPNDGPVGWAKAQTSYTGSASMSTKATVQGVSVRFRQAWLVPR